MDTVDIVDRRSRSVLGLVGQSQSQCIDTDDGVVLEETGVMACLDAENGQDQNGDCRQKR